MKKVLVIHLNDESRTEQVSFHGEEIEIQRISCRGDGATARKLIAEHDGKVDAIALEGLPAYLELGSVKKPHKVGITLPKAAKKSPVVDGREIRAGLERWGIILADRAQPGILSRKRVLMVPGLNHMGLAHALEHRSSAIRYADPVIYFGFPGLPGVGSRPTLDHAAGPTLEYLKDAAFQRLQPHPEETNHQRTRDLFKWADILAGDIGTIRRYAPRKLNRKTIVVEWASQQDVEDLRRRGASILITVMPSLACQDSLGCWSAATIEAVLAALRSAKHAPMSEDTYMDYLADLDWKPAIEYLQPDEQGVNKFAFVIHPLNIGLIHKHSAFRWTRFLPDELVETTAAYMPPMYLSRITGGKSPVTGQRIEGHLFTLAATPRQMMKHGERFTYNRLNAAARLAERKGARIMGLGAFTSVVGDAGITVAHESDIAITSGNSLTVAATLEAAKQAVIRMGATDITKGKVMIVGATGSIGSVCSRLLAQAIFDVVLVSIEPERLIDLKRTIKKETPKAKVVIATRPDDYLGECDLIVTTTSAFGKRVIDISKCKPGAVICDVARPPDINKAEAALRPDVLVIESGEVLIPGEINFGYDIGLPPGVAYACLAETALLAMEGRFEDYTLGRNITMEKVKEIYRLFKKHQFRIADLRSFDEVVTEEMLAKKRVLAEELRKDQSLFRALQEGAAAKLARIPVMAKGVKSSNGFPLAKIVGFAAGIGAITYLLVRKRK